MIIICLKNPTRLRLVNIRMEIDKKKLHAREKEIREALSSIRDLAKLPDEEFFSDAKNIAALKYYLIVALEAAGSVCIHVCARKLNKAVTEYPDCFETLRASKVFPKELGDELVNMARFRNLLVHQYWKVDDRKVLQYAREDIGVLEQYLEAIGKFVQE